MTHLTDHLTDRRSGTDRRNADEHASPLGTSSATAIDPIAAWNLAVSPALLQVRCVDPWAQVIQRSIADEHEGNHDDAARAWDEAVVWQVTGDDPTGRGEARGVHGVLAWHRDLGRLTEWSYGQELVSLEGSRGPIVQAHVRTTASLDDRTLDIPTLIVFEMSCLRVRRVTEIPGDIAAWNEFWRG